jgi:hypothetical protein
MVRLLGRTSIKGNLNYKNNSKVVKKNIFSSPCQRQRELLPSLGKRFQMRRFLKIGQSVTRIVCGGHVC